MKIKSKNVIKYTGKVYDLSVDVSSSYNIEGLGVHNSAAGSLVAYLTSITLIDPIPYNLLFSRFFNSGRSYPKHISFDEYKFVDQFRDMGI